MDIFFKAFSVTRFMYLSHMGCAGSSPSPQIHRADNNKSDVYQNKATVQIAISHVLSVVGILPTFAKQQC